MRIALRTSGGRGEYELAGSQGNIHASDLFNHEIFYEFTPDIVIPGRATALRVQGKPRIRLDGLQRDRTTHAYLLISGVLLLPQPKRELHATHGGHLMQRDAYSMTAIKVDVGARDGQSVRLRPTDLVLETADGLAERVDFAQRMAQVAQVWDAASALDTPLARLVNEHRTAVLGQNPDHKLVSSIAGRISKIVATDRDPLPAIAQQLGTELSLGAVVPAAPRDQVFGLDDATTPVEARAERIKKWREIADRGKEGAKFRADVMAAYDYRCLFTGRRLPRMGVTSSVGVDASHILPWSTHGINSVTNGLCLDKLCHWAFDQTVLRLSFDGAVNSYVLSVPATVVASAAPAGFDLEFFRSIAGPIPVDRLPREPRSWPSPRFIERFNRFADPV